MGMSVPTYDSAQVQEQALPGARQESNVSPDMLNTGADRMIRQGNAMQDTGALLNAAAIKMKHEDDLRTVQEATAKYQEATQNFTLDAKDNRTGAAAAGLITDFDKFHQDTAAEISKGLKNDEQRRAFGVMAGRSRMATRHDLGTFQLTEGHKATDASFDGLVKNTINAGAIATSDDAAMVQRDLLVNNVKAFAAVKNMQPEQEKAFTEKVLTDFHAQRIQQLVQQDPMRAQAYFEEHKGEIAGSQQAEIGGFAKKATATAAGSATAQSAWDALGPKNSTDPVNVFDMEKRIRTELKGNEPAIEAAIKGVHERDAAFKNQRIEQSRAEESSVNQLVLKGASAGDLRSTPEFIALSNKNPAAARSIMDYVENKAVRIEQRAAAAESRAYTAEVRAEHRLHKDTLDTALRIQDPTILSEMTRDQVVNLLPKLGTESTQAALHKWEVLHKDKAALAEAKIDSDQFNVFAVKAGLDPNSKNDTDKKRVVDLRDKVERIIGAEQQAKKKLLTREEKDVILQKQIDNEVIQHNSVWFDQKVPAISLPKDKQGSAYVEVGPAKQTVKVSEIPPTFRAQAMASRKGKGLDTSEAQLAELWLRSTGKFKDK